MSGLYAWINGEGDVYWDKKSAKNCVEWLDKIRVSKTVYVGNIGFHTTEDQITELFSRVGDVDNVVMGLNRITRSPCGFAFVTFFFAESAHAAVQLLNGASLDDRDIRVDPDSGENIHEQRKYGRGISGRQWRDEFRIEFDEARGGEGGGLDSQSLRENSLETDMPNPKHRRLIQQPNPYDTAPPQTLFVPFQMGPLPFKGPPGFRPPFGGLKHPSFHSVDQTHGKWVDRSHFGPTYLSGENVMNQTHKPFISGKLGWRGSYSRNRRGNRGR